MNTLLILQIIGQALRYEGIVMGIPLGIAFFTKQGDAASFLYSILWIEAISFLCGRLKPATKHLQARDGFAAVAFSWIALAAFGALPYYFCGYFASYIDCFFEAVSGFTTTGATILTQIEGLPQGILFWRSLTHWLGGMGVLVFVLAIMPTMHASAVQLLRAESPGPNPGKFVPKIKQTAMILYCIYFGMTAVLVVLLQWTGLPLFDSLIHAMGAAGTGGFSNRNLSVGAYGNVPAEIIITIFCFLFGVNFNLYYFVLKKQWKQVFQNEELRLYFFVVLVSTVLISINILGSYGGSIAEAVRHASFQVVTIITTTGYCTANFDLWPVFSKTILVMLMFMGACAGSTGGAIKVTRILLVFKTIKRELLRILHPRMIQHVKTEGKAVEEAAINGIFIFIAIYGILIILATILVSLDNKDLITGATAVISTTGNVGPGLALVGPIGNYAGFSWGSKLVLSFCMLAGRLELFPMLLIFVPAVWKKAR